MHIRSSRERASNAMALTMAAGFVGVIALALMAWMAPSVEAVQRPPRPEPQTLVLVRVFSCNPAYDGQVCGKNLEDQANDWLQKAQPGVRVVGQQLSANKYAVYLSILYEVPDWRVTAKPATQKNKKLPAEAP